MKILIFVHCYYPRHFYGTEAYTHSVAAGLQKLGHEVTVITMTPQGEPEHRPGQDQLLDHYEWQGVPVVSIDKNRLPHRGISETYYQASLRPIHERILRKFSPDIVHVTHLINHTSSLLDVTTALGIPAIATLTDFFGFCYNNKLEAANQSLCAGPNNLASNCIACHIKGAADTPWASAELNAVAKSGAIESFAEKLASNQLASEPYGFEPRDIMQRPRLLKTQYDKFTHLIAPSRFLMESYNRNGFSRISLSHFGIDIDRRKKPTRDGTSKITIGFIGQISHHKGVHILMDAFRKIPAAKMRLLVWGPHDQDANYFAQIRDASLNCDVTFCGTFESSSTADILSEIDVLVIPSTWYENSPLILLQALASHTPVIVSDVEGMTEFVQHGINGFHFKRGSSDSLYSFLRLFVDDSDLSKAMSSRTHYDRTTINMVENIDDMYNLMHKAL